MNARIKCKKLKQRIKALECMILPVRIVYKNDLLHLHLKRYMNKDYIYTEGQYSYYKDLTINQVSHDMSIELCKFVDFDDTEGIATLNVWVERRE